MIRAWKYYEVVIVCGSVYNKLIYLIARVIQDSLPFLSMHARRVLKCSGSTEMRVKLGEQMFYETQLCEEGPVYNLDNSIGATGHVPHKKISVCKLAVNKSSVQ